MPKRAVLARLRTPPRPPRPVANCAMAAPATAEAPFMVGIRRPRRPRSESLHCQFGIAPLDAPRRGVVKAAMVLAVGPIPSPRTSVSMIGSSRSG
jgi:hypothetical protein